MSVSDSQEVQKTTECRDGVLSHVFRYISVFQVCYCYIAIYCLLVYNSDIISSQINITHKYQRTIHTQPYMGLYFVLNTQ